MAHDYIPRPILQFHEFQKNLVQMVSSKAGIWNIPVAEVNGLTASSAAYENHFKNVIDKPGRSQAQVVAHKQFRKDYESELRLFVNGFLRSNKLISDTDRVNLGLKIRGKRRKHRTRIETAPVVFMESFPGAWLKMWCRIEGHIGRASLHPESEGVEICFSIGTKPKDEEECAHSFFSKKAHIRLAIKPDWRGKMFYGFMRWKNLSNDELSGPFCGVVMQMVY